MNRITNNRHNEFSNEFECWHAGSGSTIATEYSGIRFRRTSTKQNKTKQDCPWNQRYGDALTKGPTRQINISKSEKNENTVSKISLFLTVFAASVALVMQVVFGIVICFNEIVPANNNHKSPKVGTSTEFVQRTYYREQIYSR